MRHSKDPFSNLHKHIQIHVIKNNNNNTMKGLFDLQRGHNPRLRTAAALEVRIPFK